MSKSINTRITILTAIANALTKVNRGIDKVQAVVAGSIDYAQAKVVQSLNERIDKLVQERIRQSDAARLAPHTRFYAIHEQLAELRASFAEDSNRLLAQAQAEISEDKIKEAEAKASALADEAAALTARKK